MSNLENDILLERAYQLADDLASDPAGRDDQIYNLINKNDLEGLRALCVRIEGELSQQHFYGNDILERTDVY